VRRSTACASAAFAALGLGVVALLVARTGGASIAATLARMPAAIQIAVAIEGVRIALETWGTRALLGSPRVPWRVVARAQLVGYAVCYVAPLGRTAAEACKAMLLSPHATRERLLRAAASNQAGALVAVGVASVVCALAAHALSASRAEAVLALHGLALLVPGAVLFWVRRRGHRTGEGKVLGIATMLASRAMQAVSVALLVVAAGAPAGTCQVLLAWGAHLVGASLGDAAPAQLGFTDAAMLTVAPAAHVSAAAGLSVAVAMRVAQLFWVTIAAIVQAVSSVASTSRRRFGDEELAHPFRVDGPLHHLARAARSVRGRWDELLASRA
jgi:hypothetical protein